MTKDDRKPTNPLDDEALALSREFNEFIRKMTPGALIKLKRDFGIVIPINLIESTTKRRWWYRCNQCQGPALEFMGEQFVYYKEAIGELALSDRPPLGIPLEELPWTQDSLVGCKPRSVFDLTCQRCHQRVSLNPDRTLRSNLIMETRNQKKELTRGSRGIGPRDHAQATAVSRD